MYSVHSYGEMVADSGRMSAYWTALQKAIKPQCVVLDIGTGTGIFALLALKLGARRVYAIEPNDVIQTARDFAAANGMEKGIVFIQDLSARVSLPERADVIVSDLRGALPLFEGHIGSIVDARKRLLAPAGVLIPQRDTLWAALVEVPELYARHVTPWRDNDYDLDWRPACKPLLNTAIRARIRPCELLVEPSCWATLDYTTVENPDVRADVAWTIARAGTAHGLSLWFEALLSEGIGFSCAPSAPEHVYGNVVLPLLEPVVLEAGDQVTVSLSAVLVGDDYVWGWKTKVVTGQPCPRVKADYSQSTFFGTPLSPGQLVKRAAQHVPVLNEEGELERHILSLMDGGTSLEDIARSARASFPERLLDWKSAFNLAGEISLKFSR